MRAEDEAEFRQFVTGRWTRLVHAAVLLTGDRGHAEDLAQTALVRVFSSWSRVRAAQDMDAYIMRILINQNKNRFRKLPKTPQLLAEGIMDGKKWTVSGVASGGNNELTKNSQCLKLLITDGGRDRTASLGDVLLYCDGQGGAYDLMQLMYDVPGGSGSLAIGTAESRVAEIVTHIKGVAAPVTVQTVPAPGADCSIFVIPVGTGLSPTLDFDLYDAQGQKIGHADNYELSPSNLPADQRQRS